MKTCYCGYEMDDWIYYNWNYCPKCEGALEE